MEEFGEDDKESFWGEDKEELWGETQVSYSEGALYRDRETCSREGDHWTFASGGGTSFYDKIRLL